MTDLVTLTLTAGNGGNGRVAFHREKFILKGGPDGGHGGDGGSVIIRASAALATLSHYAGVTDFAAESGFFGGRKKQIGAKGEQLVLGVPLGTVVWCIAENSIAKKRRERVGIQRRLDKESVGRLVYTLEQEHAFVPVQAPDELEYFVSISEKKNGTVSAKEFKTLSDEYEDSSVPEPKMLQLHQFLTDGEELVVCQGGYGGRGNESFKSGAITTPLFAEYGTPGESRVVVLEQKLLADVGLLGYPSAGKSTLLSVLTQARPKIAAYPFTTLEPHLGVLSQHRDQKGEELVVADLPGLIEGASSGRGLGFDFLRHLDHTKVLLYVLALDEEAVFDTEMSDAEKAQTLWEQFVLLRGELAAHNKKLLQKPYFLSVNKIDIYTPELQQEIKKVFSASGEKKVFFFSAATSEGVPALKATLFDLD
jgi:GTPase